MVRKLLITLTAATLLTIAAFAAAWTVGGNELRRKLSDGTNISWGFGDGGHDDAPDVTRTLAWDGEQPVHIAAPVDLIFTRSPNIAISVTGSPQAIDRLRWADGSLSLSGGITQHQGGLIVRITGPKLSALQLDGPGNIALRHVDQPALRLDINGTASVEADGRVDALDLAANGVGDIDLGKLHARTARVKLDGIGSVTLDASDTVEGAISGIGDLNLIRKPRHLLIDQSGVGSVDQPE